MSTAYDPATGFEAYCVPYRGHLYLQHEGRRRLAWRVAYQLMSTNPPAKVTYVDGDFRNLTWANIGPARQRKLTADAGITLYGASSYQVRASSRHKVYYVGTYPDIESARAARLVAVRRLDALDSPAFLDIHRQRVARDTDEARELFAELVATPPN